MTRIFFLLCSTLCISISAAAQTPLPETVSSIGEAKVPIANITPEQARAKAIRQAKEAALRSAVGEEVRTSETLLDGAENQQFSAFSSIESRGGITAVEILDDRPLATPDGILQHYVRLRAAVRRYTTRSDPSFGLSVGGIRIGYRTGEALTFTLTPTDSCYLHLFLFDDAGRGDKLYPNVYEPERPFPAGRAVAFPTNRAIQYTLEPSRPEAREETNTLVIVQTRRKIAYTSPETDYESVSEWISRLEPDQRQVTTQAVRIIAR